MNNKMEKSSTQIRISQEIELRKMINKWELIPGAPSDEFDSLNRKMLSFLGNGADSDEIFNVLKSGLVEYYGLSIKDEDIENLAKEVLIWWGNK